MTELKIASISDIHLGNKRNTTSEIIANLRLAFPNNAETADLDIIFIAGDVFDGLLTLPDTDVTAIDAWISYLLRICSKHDICLRILNGTPSHDWGQSERFLTIAKITQSTCDVRYVKDLSIEYMERFDINVLYVPDEWDNFADRTLDQVYDLLKAKGLNAVDYAVMHGAFTHQLPDNVKCQKHNPDEYLKIVSELIFIGHIHTYSRYDRIIAQGSFDRLTHGEEEDKGHIRAVITDTNRSVTFVKNKGAKIFKSIDCSLLSVEETISRIDNVVKDLPEGSNIRVIGTSDNSIFTNMNILIRRHPLFVWSKLIRDEELDEEVIEEHISSFIPITITPENIKSLLLDRIGASGLTMEVLRTADLLLTELI